MVKKDRKARNQKGKAKKANQLAGHLVHKLSTHQKNAFEHCFAVFCFVFSITDSLCKKERKNTLMMKISFFCLLRLKLNKRFDSDRSIVFEIGEGVGGEIVLLAEEGRGLAGPEGGGGGAEHVLVSSGAGPAW